MRANVRTATVVSAAILALVVAPRAAAQEPLLPDLPAFAIEGEIRHEDGRWQADNFYARVGDLPMTGNLVVDLSGAIRSIEGFLRFPSFDHHAARALLVELGMPLPEDDDEDDEDDDRLIPAIDIETGWLDDLAINLDLEFADIQGLDGQFEGGVAHVGVRDRRLALSAVDARLRTGSTIRAGTISGEAVLDARQATPSADLALDLREINLGPFIEDTPLAENFDGILHGRLKLAGIGASLDQLFANADGKVSLAVERGWIDALSVHAAGLDVIRGLGLRLGDDERLALNCGRIDFVVADGIAEVTRLLMDTADAVVIGGGTIDLGTEQLELIFDTRQKDFTLIEAPRTASIVGTFTDFEIEIGEIEGIDFFQPPGAEPLDCAQLVGRDFWDMPW
jgi:AsmA family protein